jgi:hypothetical protein
MPAFDGDLWTKPRVVVVRRVDEGLPGSTETTLKLAGSMTPVGSGRGEPTFAPLPEYRGDTVYLDVIDRWGNMVAATPRHMEAHAIGRWGGLRKSSKSNQCATPRKNCPRAPGLLPTGANLADSIVSRVRVAIGRNAKRARGGRHSRTVSSIAYTNLEC